MNKTKVLKIFEAVIITLSFIFLLLGSQFNLIGQEMKEDVVPVGWWDFKNKSVADKSGTITLDLDSNALYKLAEDQYAVRVDASKEPSIRIPVNNNSPLAIQFGTISFWLNYAWDGRQVKILTYDNQSIDIQFYRRYLTPRFRGNKFDFGADMIDENWSEHILREYAFYPHDKALAREGEWHHFVVTYDYINEEIIGYRDSELIYIVDLSHLDRNIAMGPLNDGRRGERLREIIIGDGFSGFLGELRIYDKVLSHLQVAQIYKNTKEIYGGRVDHIEERRSELYEFVKEDSTLYNAWLQYRSDLRIVDSPKSLLNQIVVDTENRTIRTASNELACAVEKIWGVDLKIVSHLGDSGDIVLGTPETSEIIQNLVKNELIDLSQIEFDGYLIKSLDIEGKRITVIAAKEPGGVIFGVFHLIRKIGLQGTLSDLDIVSNPHAKIRIINHWDFFRGHPGDKWLRIRTNEFSSEGNRYNSIYSWDDLRTGRIKMIEDWARLLASAGWNAIAPTEINWEFRNNFLDHLDEVEVLADILRRYGIKLFWSPSYIHALDRDTADSLYARVPDFGGYLLKLGSEAQFGDPRPTMVNAIADNISEYGGLALVRSFVYGRNRYYNEIERIDGFRRYTLYRNTIPYKIFASEDGNFRNNVVIVNKASPLDWDLSAPNVTPLDGAIKKNMYAPEMMVSKQYPLSWVRKWKNWFIADNYRDGPGSLNMNYVDVVLGVSMISPSPGWTSNPINMVNYYGLGRLAWNPELDVDKIYDEWIRLTFGDDEVLVNTVKDILYLSEDVIRNLYIYRGYRGLWLDRGSDILTQNKTPHIANRNGIGIFAAEEQQQVINQFAPELQKIYMDKLLVEDYLPFFHFVGWDYKLANGNTVIEDFYTGLDISLEGAHRLLELWEGMEGYVDDRRFEKTKNHFELNIEFVDRWRDRYIDAIDGISGYSYEEVMHKRGMRNGK
jgi:alpha-glucuronidase